MRKAVGEPNVHLRLEAHTMWGQEWLGGRLPTRAAPFLAIEG